MKELHILATDRSPEVIFRPDEGLLKLFGRSVPENCTEFYHPLLEALEKYKVSPATITNLEIGLEYLNTSSFDILLRILKMLDEMAKKGESKVHIKWYYESDDGEMRDVAEEYNSYLENLQLEIIEREELG